MKNRYVTVVPIVCILAATLATMNPAPGRILAQDPDPPWSSVAPGSNHPGPAVDGGDLKLGTPQSGSRLGYPRTLGSAPAKELGRAWGNAPPGRSPVVPCPAPGSSSASNGALTFGSIFQVSGADTWGDSIFPTSDGYLLLTDHAVPGGFTPNLTEFDGLGRLVRSQDLSIAPGVPKSARVTSDGGYLIGSIHYPSPSTDEGRLFKLSSNLAVQWAKAFRTGPPSYSHVTGVAETVDGGYIALVRDGDRFGIVKMDSGGNVEWRKGILPGVEATTTTVYDVYENTYLDGAGHKECGGYILYGGVRRTGTDWDLYLAALSCDGNTLLWQRIVSGSDWEGSHSQGNFFYDDSTNLTVVEDRNGVNSQDADLLLAATTNSFGTNQAMLLVPFNVTGGTSLSSPPTFGPFKILDGPDYERLVGPFGGPNLIQLSDGNLLIGASIRSFSSGKAQSFLAKMQPSLDVIWQYTYSTEEAVGLYEGNQRILAVGGGPVGLFLSLAPDGTGEGPCITRAASHLTVSDVSPDVITPTYTLDSGTLQIADVAITTAETSASLICPSFLHLPLVLRDAR